MSKVEKNWKRSGVSSDGSVRGVSVAQIAKENIQTQLEREGGRKTQSDGVFLGLSTRRRRRRQ